MKEKIKNLKELQHIVGDLKSKDKKIVHCHGVFDLLHIGHIKHFEEAKTFGDILVVTITPDKFVHKGPNRPAFTTALRLEALSALESIDFVSANEWPIAVNTIKMIQPDIYCKGPDYKDHKVDVTGKIDDEEKAVKLIGGKIMYTEDITFSSSNLLNKFGDLYSQEQKLFIQKVVDKYSFDFIKLKIEKLKSLKVLVIGETIIDQYVFCEALGKSGKEPVLVLRDLETQQYLGGALAIARHLNAFCGTVSVLSFLGSNNEQKKFIEENIEENIQLNFLTKRESPTIIKRRFLDQVDSKKVLGVYSINDDPLNKKDETNFLEKLDKLVAEHDLVIVSDYGHGIITSQVAEHISKTDKFVSLNAQVNAANIGTHSIRKYHDVNCLIINSSELRHELRQREGDLVTLAAKLKEAVSANYITVTQGRAGAFLLNDGKKPINCPGFAVDIVDKIGAGDALLALLSVCLFSEIEEDLALFIASLAAAQSVESIGNSKPVNKVELLKTILHSLK
jgi:rfaE bifunctional protein kinase chain/domain/rfaE bifunctional protein nucleotidyltransferase chain/domain